VDVPTVVGNCSLSVEHGERSLDETKPCERTRSMNAGEPVNYLDVHLEQRTVIDWEHGYHHHTGYAGSTMHSSTSTISELNITAL